MRASHDTIANHSAVTYDVRFESRRFHDPDVKCIELFDYIGDGYGHRHVDLDGVEFDERNTWGPVSGNAYGVEYSLATRFYASYRRAMFAYPVVITIGELPAIYDGRGEPAGPPKITMEAMFQDSDIQILPRGGSRGLIRDVSHMFRNTKRLTHFGPEKLREAGLSGVRDPEANRRIRSNGLDESAFLLHLAPERMVGMFHGSTYPGHGVQTISWKNLKAANAAEGFAHGCHFLPHILTAIVDAMHFDRFNRKRFTIPKLDNVDLGRGRVTGATAHRARELIEDGIDLCGFSIG